MTRILRMFAVASALIIAGLIPAPAFAQKSGGVLKVHHQDSPASMSIIEEATYSVGGAMSEWVVIGLLKFSAITK